MPIAPLMILFLKLGLWTKEAAMAASAAPLKLAEPESTPERPMALEVCKAVAEVAFPVTFPVSGPTKRAAERFPEASQLGPPVESFGGVTLPFCIATVAGCSKEGACPGPLDWRT